MPSGNTVTNATYADLFKNHLRPAIKSKRRGLLSTGVLLQHDNARPHTARLTVATIQNLSFECLPHPPYSPDLAPSDFHVFGSLKEVMGGKSFRSDDCHRVSTQLQLNISYQEVQQAVHEWPHSQPQDYCCAVVLRSPIVLLSPVGHSSNHEYHCFQLTGQSSGVSNFYHTFKVFISLTYVLCTPLRCVSEMCP